jgi:hypothetical protein
MDEDPAISGGLFDTPTYTTRKADQDQDKHRKLINQLFAATLDF